MDGKAIEMLGNPDQVVGRIVEFYNDSPAVVLYPIILLMVTLFYLCSGTKNSGRGRRTSSVYVGEITKEHLYCSRTTIGDGSTSELLVSLMRMSRMGGSGIRGL